MKSKLQQKKVVLLFPRFYEGFVMRKVPLGLAYLAASLKASGVYVEAYNLNVDTIESIDFSKFDFAGITCLTPFLPEIRKIAKYINASNPGIKIVIGGSHPTDLGPPIFEQLPFLSYSIIGEGELSFVALVSDEGRRQEIPGVYYRESDGSINGTPPAVPDINRLPLPDQRLFDHGHLEKQNPFRAILAARGCPFKCRNCQPILSKTQKFRTRETAAVVDEIAYLQRVYRQKYFGFLDSEFPMHTKWFIDFFEGIKKKVSEFSFHCNAHSSLLNEDIIKLYKELNITRLAIGIESGVQRVIDEVLLKKIDLEHTHAMFEIARKYGIKAHGHFMIGIPGETMEDMQQTLKYAVRLNAASIEFNMLTPWPGTAFYQICSEKGYLTELNTDTFNEKRVSYVSTEAFTNKQVVDFYQQIRSELCKRGWVNSSDGSVYYHPDVGHY